MVNVGVGDDDLPHLQIVLFDQGEDVFNVVAGIDDHGLARGFVADDGAVALQAANGDGFVDHWSIVRGRECCATATPVMASLDFIDRSDATSSNRRYQNGVNRPDSVEHLSVLMCSFRLVVALFRRDNTTAYFGRFSGR